MTTYTKTQLKAFGITKLKEIGRDLRVPRYSTFNSTNKHELEERILKFQSSIAPTQPPVAPTQPPVAPTQPSLVPRQPPVAPTQPPLVPTQPPRQPTVVVTPPRPAPKPNVYNFETNEILDLDVELTPFKIRENVGSTTPPSTKDDITPEILNKLIEQDDFLKNVQKTLTALYKAKYKKYSEIYNKVTKSIEHDNNEKKKLYGVVDSQKLDNMFPMIAVNSAMMVKVEDLKDKAKNKINKPDTIATIKKNLSNAVNNIDSGILSISGDNRAAIRNSMCKTLYILSKGDKPFMDAFINMVFTGPAGVGKTRLADTMGYVYAQSGILLGGDVIVVSPKDLVGEFVGQTAGKAAGVLMKGLENILFIDEAYQIMPCQDGEIQTGSRSFGPEAITEIVNFLDKYIGLSIMIVAGYEREMKGCFFAANEGLNRRFPVRYQLPKYDINSLLNIFLSTVSKRLDQNIFFNCKDNPDKQCGAVNYIYTIMVLLNKQDPKIFENQAGDMVNLASIFINVYYGSYGLTWPKDGPSMVNMAFSQFLKNKQYDININVKS